MASTATDHAKQSAVEQATREKAKQELIKQTTQAVMDSIKKTAKTTSDEKTYKAKTGKHFRKRGGGPETPPPAGPTLGSETKLAKGQFDVTPTGSRYISNKSGASLASAPSIGANVNARLQRLQNKIQTDIFKKDTGIVSPKLQAVVSGVNVRTRTQRQPGAFERGTETVQQHGPGGQDVVYPAAAMTKKSAASSTVTSPRALRY